MLGKVLPLAPSLSSLPWAVEHLRFCPWCDQLAQKDLNDCPTCGRRMAAFDDPEGASLCVWQPGMSLGSQQVNVEAWDRALASTAAVFRSCAERGRGRRRA